MTGPEHGPPTALLVAPYVPPRIGGLENYVGQVARGLTRDHGWRVVLASTWPGPETAAAAQALVADCPDLQLAWLPMWGRVSNTPVGMGWARALRRMITRHDVSLVNAHAPVPLLADVAARAAGSVPFVLTYHTGPMRKGHPVVDAGLRAYEATLLRRTVVRATAVVCTSPYVRSTLTGLPGRSAAVIPPSVDVRRFSPAGQPLPGRTLFVATLDRSARYKGLPTLLAAVARLRHEGADVHLEVVGDGDMAEEYRSDARSLGIEAATTFSGRLTGDELVAAYRRAEVIALPTTFDNYPTILLEAMACGRPVVASRVGSIPDIVLDGGTGFVTEPGDVDQLVDRIGRLLGDAGLRAGMGRAARERAETEMSSDRMVADTDRLFRGLLRQARPQTQGAS